MTSLTQNLTTFLKNQTKGVKTNSQYSWTIWVISLLGTKFHESKVCVSRSEPQCPVLLSLSDIDRVSFIEFGHSLYGARDLRSV